MTTAKQNFDKDIYATSKPIIIDGIDVSECEFYNKVIGEDGYCNIDEEHLCTCISYDNCHYKLYKRKEQKLEKIKEILEIHKDNKCTICPKFDECFEQPSCDNVILQIIKDK